MTETSDWLAAIDVTDCRLVRLINLRAGLVWSWAGLELAILTAALPRRYRLFSDIGRFCSR